ncbi:MAG: adenylosuccinate lyase [Candidatus Pacearchaeota archaeon]|nr:adenylosuccinate lyase [Candidatus Pacearchaeota archaeon]
MVKDRTKYSSMLGTRYGKDMSPIFSDDFKFRAWRQCWIALAEAQCELGLAGVTPQQVAQLKQYATEINYDVAEAKEREIRHDVMSHVYAFGQQCPEAKGIIHAGATSCDITDNAELIQIYEALDLTRKKLVNLLGLFGNFARQYRDLPILAFTHFQAAQPTTLGERAAMWGYAFTMDYEQVRTLQQNKRLRGLKGATGTQASFLELAEGNEFLVIELNKKFLEKLGYDKDFPITSQTYPRKYDSMILATLAGIGESAHKFGTDIRLMQHRKEMEEPFEKDQTGSSAMPYKRNPMRSERMCGLARSLLARELESRMTASVQWLERTLDDSAPRRDYIAQAFCAVDEVLNLAMNIMERPVVFPRMIKRHLDLELPFMATENIMMTAVKKGKDRQVIHEAIRGVSQEAARRIKEEGDNNHLLEMLAADPKIGMTKAELDAIVDVRKFIGRAPQEADEFVEKIVEPILNEEKACLGLHSNVQV